MKINWEKALELGKSIDEVQKIIKRDVYTFADLEGAEIMMDVFGYPVRVENRFYKSVSDVSAPIFDTGVRSYIEAKKINNRWMVVI